MPNHYMSIVKYAHFLVLVDFGGSENSVSYNLGSRSRSGASLSERLAGAWSPLSNFFANNLLSLPHALLIMLCFFGRGVAGEGVEGDVGAGGTGVRADERDCDRSTSLSLDRSIGDTIGDVRLSQADVSRVSNWSPVASGPMRMSRRFRRSSASAFWRFNETSTNSSPENRGKYLFFREPHDWNEPVSPTSWSGIPEEYTVLVPVISGESYTTTLWTSKRIHTADLSVDQGRRVELPTRRAPIFRLVLQPFKNVSGIWTRRW